ncbi:hypothetical protein BV20DRAFT_916760, partial [Pilatotrama ljubarskyi]
DFALRANGGRVALPLTSGQGGLLASRDNDPGIAIDDDVHAGKCWRLHTLPSQLGIRLPRMIHPESVTVEHLSTEVPLDIGEAPKNMTLWGLIDGKLNKDLYEALLADGVLDHDGQTPTISRGYLWAPLVSFFYDIHHENPVQTFAVRGPFLQSSITVGVVAVEVLENWGGNSTCLYRVRIHGS